MAQNVTVAGAAYTDVPAVALPATGGGTAEFYDVSATTATADDVASGKTFYSASGALTTGTASGGGGSGGGPYIKHYTNFRNDTVYLNNWEIAQALVPATPGDTVYIYTLGDFILQSVTREDTGESIPFTTTNRHNYSFVMPNANVIYELLYDD